MPGLAEAPLGKEELLEVLSNKEGAATAAGHGFAGAGDEAGEYEAEEDPGDFEGQAPEEGAEGYHQGSHHSEFEEFLNAEDPSGEEYGDEGLGDIDFGEADDYTIPAAARQAGGVLSTYRGSNELHQSLQHQRTNKGLERLQHDHAAKVGAADDAKIALENEEQRLRGLRKQVASGQVADPARLGYQEREVGKAWDRLTQAEKARDAAELALLRVQDVGFHAGQQASQEQKDARAVARETQSAEVKRAKLLISQAEAAKEASKERTQAVADEEGRKDGEAKKHQNLGVKRLNQAHSRLDDIKAQAEEVREARFSHDAQRILTLKASKDVIDRQIQSQNERAAKKAEKIKQEREQQRKSLLEEGQNPYEVWRREEMQADKEKQKMKSKMQAELRSEKLLEQLMVEERMYKKGLKEARVKRAEDEDFQRQVGNYAKEHKIASYIRKMTIGNVEVLDPTGAALRIDPSKVTIQKTHAFGLGGARTEEIEKVDREVQRGNRRIEKWKSMRDDDSEVAEPTGPTKSVAFGRATSQGSFGMESANQAETETESAFDEENEAGENKLWVPSLTKLEEQYMAAARERQKQNICSTQFCWGKEFTGDAFLAKPSIIAFNDFEVGKRYRQVVEVTNVSLTFNQFKLLPLDDKVKDFFEIHFVPPGRMSAGVTRYITIWFCPKTSHDIVSTFPILAKTGRIDFPLRCTTKKTILTVTPQDADASPVIDFGQVLSGESAQRALTVKNTGALPAGFTLEPVGTEGSGDGDFLRMINWRPEKSEFKEHGSTKISFNFAPEAIGTFSTVLRLSIANGAPGDANFEEEKRVLVRGSCLNVPIFVDQEEYDLRTCVYGHTFRESVIVRNRQSVAMKIQVQKPTQIPDELQLNTTLAYIQGHKEQAIQVKFCPKEDFLSRNPQYRDASRPGVEGAFRIPMRIVGADQVLPVNTALVGNLTSNGVEFQPTMLAFGRCFVGSSVVCRLTVHNESQLKQRFAFMRLPAYLSVQDVPTDVLEEEARDQLDTKGGSVAVLDGGGDGTLGSLLPGERRQLSVTYSPEAATEMDYNIVFKVITGDLCVRDFSIGCLGQGVSRIISFSETQVDMASIPCGAMSKESVVITNNSKVAQLLNVLVPLSKVSGLRVSPICVQLEPHESKRLQIEFRPTKDFTNLLKKPVEEIPEPAEGEQAAPTPVDGEEQKPEEQEISPEEFENQQLASVREYGGRRWEDPETGTLHCSWRLGICVRPAGVPNDVNGKNPKTSLVYLGVNTCVLPTVLLAEPAQLDFGEVTAGQRHLLPVTLTNLALQDGLQDLHMEALPENQCFTVLNAARPVGGKPFQLMVEFKPQLVQIYQCTLSLRTQNTRLQVPLRGKGVRPVLKIEPENGVIHMGSVVFGKGCKDYTTAKLEIKNESPFELPYKLETIIRADPNHTGPPPFTLTPSSGTVEANGSKTVTVTFRPHRPMAVFREKILVNVPNQKEPTYVYLYGHCFKWQNYSIYGMEFCPFSHQEAERKASFVDALAVGTGSGFSPGAIFEYPRAQMKEFNLVFELTERLKTLIVGACVPPGTPSAPQDKVPAATYDFQILPSEFASFFTVEVPEGSKPEKQAKGPLQAGKSMVVAFRYSPPEATSLVYGGVDLDLLGGIGQWISCKAKGVLAGGYVPALDAPNATQEITVELKAYLQQI